MWAGRPWGNNGTNDSGRSLARHLRPDLGLVAVRWRHPCVSGARVRSVPGRLGRGVPVAPSHAARSIWSPRSPGNTSLLSSRHGCSSSASSTRARRGTRRTDLDCLPYSHAAVNVDPPDVQNLSFAVDVAAFERQPLLRPEPGANAEDGEDASFRAKLLRRGLEQIGLDLSARDGRRRVGGVRERSGSVQVTRPPRAQAAHPSRCSPQRRVPSTRPRPWRRSRRRR